MATAVAGRALVLLLALAAAAWFALGVHQAQDTNRASAILSSAAPLGTQGASRASSLLNDAAFLNPDRLVDVLRARLDADRGDLGAARRVLKQVVKVEPDNLMAWLALANASAHNLRDLYAAEIAILQLAPPIHAP